MSRLSMQGQHLQFVTGRLAEASLRAVVEPLAESLRFTYRIDVLPITVAALMTPEWIARKITVDAQATRILLPGYTSGDLAPIADRVNAEVENKVAGHEKRRNVVVERGPRDLRRLPQFFGQSPSADDYGAHDIAILAEINHAPRMSLAEIIALAERYAGDGADLIDLGCEPQGNWLEVAETVLALRELGLRVSIDSFNRQEVERAVAAGAELVLSVNSTNREAACDWGCEVVVVPDDPHTLTGLDETVDYLAQRGVSLRIDPIVEPIGFGFANSLGRYLEIRRRYPDAEMMMGIGNLSELTDVDTAGVNTLLLGFCQELSIRSVLTTEVIPWARSSVAECNVARRLVHYAVQKNVLPKHLETKLLMLRDAQVVEPTNEELNQLALDIRDHSYRIFASDGKVHLVGNDLHLAEADPFVVMQQLLAKLAADEQAEPNASRRAGKSLDASHAFYLGYEMAKAQTALTLGKQYVQDEPLDWGFLTEAEPRHRLRSMKKSDGHSSAESPE